MLSGWNIVNKLAPYTPEAIGFDDDDVAFLRRNGFDTVRLGMVWKGLEPRPGQLRGCTSSSASAPSRACSATTTSTSPRTRTRAPG